MITLDLVEFIEKEEKNGTTRDKIKSTLIEAGWLVEDIEEGFQKVAPAFVVPKTIEPIAPKIQTTFTPRIPDVAPVENKVDVAVPIEVKNTEPEKIAEVKIVEPVQPTPSVQPISPIVEPAPVSVPVSESVPESISIPEIKTEPKIEPEIPKIDPYREVVKEEKPIENSFSASVPPSNLPKVWTPSNIPVVSTENTEVIPRLIPKKVEPVVPPKAILPPVRTPERKAELAKVYQNPPVVQVEKTIVPPVVNSPTPVDPVAVAMPTPDAPVPASVSTLVAPVADTIPTPAVSVPGAINIIPSSAPTSKPPYMVFAKQELSKPAPGPSSTPISAPAPYSPNSAVTSSFTRDSKNFVFEEKKPGVPRFIVGVFIFVVLACIFGGLAFAYMTGLIDIPFLPKINQTAVTAKYIDPMINTQNTGEPTSTVDQNLEINNISNSLIDSGVDVNTGSTTSSGAIITPVPKIEDLKNKDKKAEESISNIELQIYKKYALNKNQYGLKSNLKGSCTTPEKDSLFYTDPSDMSANTISSLLSDILTNTGGEGSCYSTTKAWAMSFPLASESGSYICVDSTNKKITTKITLVGTVCK